ncbi:MAG: hypothetical protein V1735_01075 [Nanoarchaeota archaeon]
MTREIYTRYRDLIRELGIQNLRVISGTLEEVADTNHAARESLPPKIPHYDFLDGETRFRVFFDLQGAGDIATLVRSLAQRPVEAIIARRSETEIIIGLDDGKNAYVCDEFLQAVSLLSPPKIPSATAQSRGYFFDATLLER